MSKSFNIYRKRGTAKTKIICKQCRKKFLIQTCKLPIKKFCSTTCRDSNKRKYPIIFNCKNCGVEFSRKFGRYLNYCSRKCSGLFLSEDKSPSWKGNNVGYFGLHLWVKKHLGSPSLCENCYSKDRKKYEWANISGKYFRDLSDWVRLCTKCHRKYDYAKNKTEV